MLSHTAALTNPTFALTLKILNRPLYSDHIIEVECAVKDYQP